MRKTICALVAFAALSPGCSREDDVLEAARIAGWESVTDIHHLNVTCEDGETAYSLQGKNYRGENVNVMVCCEETYFKRCKIRD